MSVDEALRVLQLRAAELARPSAVAPVEQLEVIRFERGSETFLVETRFVVAVTPPSKVARLPRAEPPVSGIAVHRGELLVVADVLPATEWTGVLNLIVIGTGGPAVGLLTDAITGLEHVGSSKLLPAARGGNVMVCAVTDEPASLIDAELLLRTFSGRQS